MLTTKDTISFNCGSYGKETMEIMPVKIRDTDAIGLKLKTIFKFKKGPKAFIKYTEVFLNREEIENLYWKMNDVYENRETEITYEINDKTIIELAKSTINEKTANGDIHHTEGMMIILKRINEDGYMFSAVTTVNNATTDMILSYLYDFFNDYETKDREEKELVDA